MRRTDEEKEKKDCKNFLITALWSILILLVVQNFWPDVIPFRTFEFWGVRGGWRDWFGATWPLLVWGTGVTAIIRFTTLNERWLNRHAESVFGAGALISVFAGVVEEICFRWLIFLGAIVGAKVCNFLFFGWLGWGMPEWFQVHAFGPLADFFTLGRLHDWLYHPAGWEVGSAILTANAAFRNGHKYQGLFGYVNSWFCGMYFFWLMFHFGLPVAILAHFVYDLLIFAVIYVDAAIERAQERT